MLWGRNQKLDINKNPTLSINVVVTYHVVIALAPWHPYFRTFLYVIFPPQQLSSNRARAPVCVSRQAKAMPPKSSPHGQSPAAWPMANPTMAKQTMAKPKFQMPVPINRWYPNIPKAQPIESYEHIDTSAICDRLGIGQMQPKSPKPAPFNVFVAKASVPQSASIDSIGTAYSDTAWSANLEEIQRVVDKGPNVGHAASSLTAAGSSSASSLTAAGGSDRTAADQRTSAPVSIDLVSPIGERLLVYF